MTKKDQMRAHHKGEIEYGDDWFSLTGPQLNSLRKVRMTCQHRQDGKATRFIFKRHTVEAVVGNLVDREQRGLTCIGNATVKIRQVEHILSALYGMDCSDTDIRLEYVDGKPNEDVIAPPVAHLDTMDFTLAIRRSFNRRKRPQAIELDHYHVIKEVGDGNDNSFVVFAPHGSLNITAHINFPHFWGNQVVTCTISPEKYELEICWARSFFATPYPHKAEWKELRQRFPGLIRERESHYRSIMLDYNHQKWLTPPFSNDEPAKHKLLDFIGDLALFGQPLNASIYIYKPHHRFNCYSIEKLYSQLFG